MLKPKKLDVWKKLRQLFGILKNQNIQMLHLQRQKSHAPDPHHQSLMTHKHPGVSLNLPLNLENHEARALDRGLAQDRAQDQDQVHQLRDQDQDHRIVVVEAQVNQIVIDYLQLNSINESLFIYKNVI